MGRKLIWASAILWTGSAAYASKETLVFLSIGVHGILWMLHNLEVKVNRLLDHVGIVVTDKDLRDG